MTDPSDYELFGLGELEGPENERPNMDVVPRNEQEPRVYPPAGGPEAREESRRAKSCGKCGDENCDDDDCDDRDCDKPSTGKSCPRCGSDCRGKCQAMGKACAGCGSSKCGGCDGKLIPMHGPTGTVNFDE